VLGGALLVGAELAGALVPDVVPSPPPQAARAAAAAPVTSSSRRDSTATD
jgi:hypothetical protein